MGIRTGSTRLGACVALLVAAVASAATGYGISLTQGRGAAAGRYPIVRVAASLPSVELARFAPSGTRFVRDLVVQLVPGGPREVVLVFATRVASVGMVGRDMRIVAWNGRRRRWSVVFDASEPAPRGVGDLTGPFAAPLPAAAAIFGLNVEPIASSPGRTDLAFWSPFSFGANEEMVVGIVHGSVDGYRLVYGEVYENGSDAEVVGLAPYQELSVSVGWLLGDDALCCSARTYTETVGLRSIANDGGSAVLDYGVTSSNQSWLGVTVDGAGTQLDVVSVTAGGPAFGLLQRGDAIVGVRGLPLVSSIPGDNAPSIMDTIADQPPRSRVMLVVRRDGRQRTVAVVLGSAADPRYPQQTLVDPFDVWQNASVL